MSHLTKWMLRAACAALYLPFLPPLFTGRIFVTGDLEAFQLPNRYIYQQALVARDSLLWTSSILAGFYIHGEGQTGMLHPLHLALYRFFPLHVAFNLELIANYAFALPGMYLFLRRLAFSPEASLFGAMLFTFSGFNLLHHEHLNLVALVAHIPWLLIAADMVVSATTRTALIRGYAALVVVIASELLLGFPQAVWWNMLTLGTFVIFRTRGQRDRRALPLAAIAGALVTAGLISAVQLLPTADVTAHSIRGLLDRTFALSFSLHPLNLLQLWSPYVFRFRVYSVRDAPFPKEFGIYSGAILILSLAWVWIRRGELQQRRPLIVALVIFAAVSLVLTLGYYGGLHTAMTFLPIFNSLRAPTRYIVLVDFALTILTAIVVDDFLSLQRGATPIAYRRLIPLFVPFGLSVGTTLLLNAGLISTTLPFSSLSRALVGTAMVGITTAVAVCAARGRRWAVPALVVVTAADLALWGAREVWRDPPRTIESLYSSAVAPASGPGRETLFKTTFDFPGNILVLRGYRLSSGYSALPPSTHFHISTPIFQQLAGTIWEYAPEGRKPLPGAVARARLVDDARVTEAFWRDYAIVDLHRTALLDHDVSPLSGPVGTARVVIDRPAHIIVETTAPGRQVLATSERFHPGWSTTIDGRSAETLAIHGDFVGAVVEAGTHRVEFRFMPESFVHGAAISIFGLLLFALVVGAGIAGRDR